MAPSDSIVCKAFDALRLPAALGVVLFHNNDYLSSGTESVPDYCNFISAINHNVLNCLVPLFLFMAGFLYFRNGPLLPLREYIAKSRRRFSSIVIPFIIWNLILLFYQFLYSNFQLPNLFAAPQFLEIDGKTPFTILKRCVQGFYNSGWTGMPFDAPLWFLRDIIVISLASPLISMMLKLKPAGSFLAIMCLSFIATIAPANVLLQNFIFNMAVFSTGAWVACYGRGLLKPRALPATIALFLSATYFRDHSSDTFYRISSLLIYTGIILSLVTATMWACRNSVNHRNHSALSFFIYAAHYPIFLIMDRFIVETFDRTSVTACIAANILAFSIGTLVCIALWRITKACAPRLASLLTGSRISGPEEKRLPSRTASI